MNIIKKFFMKEYERKLYDDLQPNKGEETYLGKVKNAIGAEILSSKYVPKFKAEIAITITTHYLNGVWIAPAALPAALQTFYPVYLLGLTDYQALYARIVNLVNSPVWDINTILVRRFGEGGLPVIPGAVRGDLIISMNDALLLGCSIFIVIHCNNVAYTTFLNAIASDLLTLNMIKYIVPAANLTQFNNPLNLVVQSLLGKLATDTVDPRMFMTSQNFQNTIADIPIKLPIDKNLILATLVDFDCVNITLLFSVLSMQPLTNRYK